MIPVDDGKEDMEASLDLTSTMAELIVDKTGKMMRQKELNATT